MAVALPWGFFALGEGRGLSGEGGDGRKAVGVAVCSAGCTHIQVSSCSGICGGSVSGLRSGLMSPRRMASSSCVEAVLHCTSMDFRSEASNMSSPLRTNKGPYTTAVLMILTPWHGLAAPLLRPGSSAVSVSGSWRK